MDFKNTLKSTRFAIMARPVKWEDPEAFDKAVDAYFDNPEITHTWTGLAIHLGFASRDSLNDYKKKDGFSDSVKKALLKIESKYEENLFGRNPAGSIFALKNFGWKDKQEVEQTIHGDLSFNGIQIIKPDASEIPTQA